MRGIAPRAPTLGSVITTTGLELRAGARRLRARESSVDDLRELGAVLERHVRFEERELFPRIEAGLSAERLRKLGQEIEHAEVRR